MCHLLLGILLLASAKTTTSINATTTTTAAETETDTAAFKNETPVLLAEETEHSPLPLVQFQEEPMNLASTSEWKNLPETAKEPNTIHGCFTDSYTIWIEEEQQEEEETKHVTRTRASSGASVPLHQRQSIGDEKFLQLRELPEYGYYQDDDWSCGIQSTTRVLWAYWHDVSYWEQRSRIPPMALELPWDPCEGTILPSCQVSLRIENVYIKIGRPPHQIAAALRNLGYSNWKHENGSNMNRLKTLLDQNKPVVVLIRENDIARADLCYDFGGFIGRECLYSVTFPYLHYVTVVGYNIQGFQYYDTDNSELDTYTYAEFENKWNFKGWNTGLVYNAYYAYGAQPRSFLYNDLPLLQPSPGCDCNCCGADAFCLVPCGCDCFVPSTSFARLKVKNNCHLPVYFDAWFRSLSPSEYDSALTDGPGEGIWQWSAGATVYWVVDPGETIYYENTNNLEYFYYAEEPTTGGRWSGSDLTVPKGYYSLGLRRKEAQLGETAQITLTCDNGLPTARFRLYVRNACEWYGDLWVIFRYYHADTRQWTTGSWRLDQGGDYALLLNAASRNVYYYAKDYATGSVEWKGSDYTIVSDSGRQYSARLKDLGGTYGRKTMSLTCSCTPRHCVWGSWGAWSTCVDYWQERHRSVLQRQNACGDPCYGLDVERRECTPPTLPPTLSPGSENENSTPPSPEPESNTANEESNATPGLTLPSSGANVPKLAVVAMAARVLGSIMMSLLLMG